MADRNILHMVTPLKHMSRSTEHALDVAMTRYCLTRA